MLLDPRTGNATFQGYLDDLLWWQRQVVYDDRTRTAYVLGTSVQNERWIYALPLDDVSMRTVTSAAPPPSGAQQSYTVAGSTLAGQLVATYWTGTREGVVLLDPATGSTQEIGTLDGLHSSSSQVLYDDTTRTLYALGKDPSGVSRVFSFSLDTHRSSVAGGVRGDYAVAGVTQKGELVVAYWDGVEEAALLDPRTGRMRVAGGFTGLASWSSQVMYGAANGTVVAYGQDADDAYHFYEITLGG